MAAVFPQHVRDFIQDNHQGVGPKAMTDLLNAEFGTEYTYRQVKGYYNHHGVNSGQTGRFEKGRVAPNKGKKGTGVKHDKQFKPGHQPENTQPLGHERVCKDGYIVIKVRMQPSAPGKADKYVPKHRMIWEEAHGPIPPKHVIIFKDGNKLNWHLDNLAMVTRAELNVMSHRQLFNTDADLTELGISIAKLQAAVRSKKKKARKHRIETDSEN